MNINDDTWITTNVTQKLLRQMKAEMKGQTELMRSLEVRLLNYI